jgi:hypothetical protein
MKYKITGAFQDSGKDVVIEIEAKNEEEMRKIVNLKGILINKIEQPIGIDNCINFKKDLSVKEPLNNLEKKQFKLNVLQVYSLFFGSLIILLLLLFPPMGGIAWQINKDFVLNFYDNSESGNWDQGLWTLTPKNFVGFHFLLYDKDKDYYSNEHLGAVLDLDCLLLKRDVEAKQRPHFGEHFRDIINLKVKRYNITNINYYLLFVLIIIVSSIDLGVIFLSKNKG